MKASKAWDANQLNKAADLYEKALKDGGLFPDDVLLAFVRIGTARANQGKRPAALSAFKNAALINPDFELPSQARPPAKALAKQAKTEAAKQGGKLEVTAEVPTKSAPGAKFNVVAHVGESFVPLLAEVGISVEDPSIASQKPWSAKKAVDASVTFEVPSKVVLAGANLLVRVDVYDNNGNRWASSQSRVKVDSPPVATAPMPATFDDEKPKKKEDGFWKSPWPWVIGGAIIAGGVTTYFITRPTDEAAVSAPAWR